jgi:hypothetical protein
MSNPVLSLTVAAASQLRGLPDDVGTLVVAIPVSDDAEVVCDVLTAERIVVAVLPPGGRITFTRLTRAGSIYVDCSGHVSFEALSAVTRLTIHHAAGVRAPELASATAVDLRGVAGGSVALPNLLVVDRATLDAHVYAPNLRLVRSMTARAGKHARVHSGCEVLSLLVVFDAHTARTFSRDGARRALEPHSRTKVLRGGG